MYFAVIGILVLNRLWLRDAVLAGDSPAWMRVFVLSLPNLLEAVLGMGLVSSVLHVARSRLAPRFDGVSDRSLAVIAATLTAVYVVAQELNFHSLGGQNVADLNDVGASLLGLAIMFLIVVRYGVVERLPGS